MINSDLFTKFLIEFGFVLSNPGFFRVIVETDENTVVSWYDRKTGAKEYDNLYFMIDHIDGKWVISSNGGASCVASPKNVVKWAASMTRKNRISAVYNETY